MNDNILLNIYKNFLKIRYTEEEIAKRYPENEMRCPTHLSIGQEAVSAVYASIINKNDYAVSTHRGHAHYIAKGGNLNALIAELYGKQTGCSKGKGGSMHLIDLDVNFMGTSAIVGNSIPIGVGLGLSQKLKNRNFISTIFIGEGATEEGVFFESVNFSIVRNLPILFICENNLYSVYSSLQDRQPKDRQIYKMVKALGANSSRCDGNNLSDTYKAMSSAYKYVKEKSKPFFLECKTYRFLEHCGPNNDDSLNYRSQKEIKFWKKRDPLLNINKIVKEKFTEHKLNKIRNNVMTEVNTAFLFAKKSKFPKENEAYQGNYA